MPKVMRKIMPDLIKQEREWHIRKAKGFIFDASIHRSNNRSWKYYIDIVVRERKMAFDCK